jgi:hypothetical protein
MTTEPRPPQPAAPPRSEAAAGRPAPDAARRTARAAPHADPERALRTCPNCGRALAERGCKLRCPDPACGYFLSCAEYH